MEKNLNFEYKGFKANGFVMMFASLALTAAGIWGIIYAVNNGTALTAILGVIGIIVALISLIGLMVIEPIRQECLCFSESTAETCSRKASGG